jgi:hypothetical protein
MNTRLQTQVQATPALSFTPVPRGLLQRKCACGNHTMARGECAECAKKKRRLQRKLSIGASNDPLEQEADRITDQVMAAPAHSAMSGTPPRIQRFTGHSTGENGTAPTSVDRVLASPGRPLEPALQHDMGRRFGHNFSRVRVHSNAAAEQSAREVNAHAYTVGHNIVFGAGRFAPGLHDGRRLLAHELAHVIQQSAGDAPMVQRQIKIPIFDEFDPCVIDPVFGKKVCGSYAKTLCEKFPSIPGCSFVCKKLGCKNPDKPSVACPPGFRPGASADFKGQCCIEKKKENPDKTTEDQTIESASNCCPPARAASTPLGLRCCAADEVASNGECIKGTGPQPPGPTPGPVLPACLPGEKPNLFGGCCGPGDKVDKRGNPCLFAPTPAPPPKPPATPPPGNVVLHFNLDQPAIGTATTEGTLLRSITAASKPAWPDLVKQLQSNPTWKLQLVGKASPEGPSSYNFDLAKRRAQLVEQVLVDKGIERIRITDLAPECTRVETGVYSCGEVGANDPADRQVKVVFDAGAGVTP